MGINSQHDTYIKAYRRLRKLQTVRNGVNASFLVCAFAVFSLTTDVMLFLALLALLMFFALVANLVMLNVLSEAWEETNRAEEEWFDKYFDYI